MSVNDTIFVMDDVDLPDEASGPKTKYPFETMQIGGMFFLPGRKASKFAPYSGKFGRRTGRKFQVRDVFMTKRMKDGNQVGWDIATSGTQDAVSGCAVKRLADPTPAEAEKDKATEAAADKGQAQAQVPPLAAVDPPKAEPAKADTKHPAKAK